MRSLEDKGLCTFARRLSCLTVSSKIWFVLFVKLCECFCLELLVWIISYSSVLLLIWPLAICKYTSVNSFVISNVRIQLFLNITDVARSKSYSNKSILNFKLGESPQFSSSSFFSIKWIVIYRMICSKRIPIQTGLITLCLRKSWKYSSHNIAKKYFSIFFLQSLSKMTRYIVDSK